MPDPTPADTRRPTLLARAFDTVAEAVVAPSFSRLGIAGRRWLEHWEQPDRQDGRVVLVTGATSGIGLAAASALAALGADVHLVGRDGRRGAAALEQVRVAGSGEARLHLADLSDAAAVMAVGAQLADECDRLDALVHNAGSLTRAYQRSADGAERTVATHILGPYVLTAALAPLLWAAGDRAAVPAGGASSAADGAAPPTIVTVSSGGMYAQRFDLDRLEMAPDDYDGVTAYARAKRAQLVLAAAWAECFAPARVASYAMHPGWVDTPGLESGLPRFRRWWRPLLRTPAEGADTVVWLAGGGPAAEARAQSRPVPRAGWYHDRHRRSEYRFPVTGHDTPTDGEALLVWCARRTGVGIPRPTGAG
ncbi:MAG: SDR family NAD(P)-dependent oxidoreductase [Acidimicrobiales bacterium]